MFKVGQRVTSIKSTHGGQVNKGLSGKVIIINNTGLVGVEYDEYVGGHGCAWERSNNRNIGEYGKCWWEKPENLELEKDLTKTPLNKPDSRDINLWEAF